MNIFERSLLILCVSFFCLPLCWSEEEGPRPMRITMRHIEAGGIGYDQGYTTLEGFFSPSEPFRDAWLPFLDLRGHLFNNFRPAANVGIGARYLSSSRVWGGSVYYDYRKTKRQDYNQIAAGFECLGKWWDFRLNGYLPVGTNSSSFWDAQFDYFQGHYAFLSAKREYALKGANAEAGVHLAAGKNVQFVVAGGPYYLKGKSMAAWGGEARVEMSFPYLKLEGSVSYDHLFRWRGQGQVGLSIPFGNKRKIQTKSNVSYPDALELAYREVQPVNRFEIIPVNHKRQVSKAIDPSTGEPYFFWFVNNTSSSLGTFESPFPTLLTAQNVSSEGNVIYVFPGDGTSSGMDAGIILQDRQYFWGAGIAQILPTTLGMMAIPPQARGIPNITASAGDPVVNVANKNSVSGFQITSDGGGVTNGSYCIGAELGTTSDLFVSSNNLIANNGAVGISPSNPSGTIEITQNTIQSIDSQGTYGIYLTPTGATGKYLITDNIISNFRNNTVHRPSAPTGIGVAVFVQDQSDISATVAYNQISNCIASCIEFRADTGAPLFTGIAKNNELRGALGGSAAVFLSTGESAEATFTISQNFSLGNGFGVIADSEDSSSMTGSIQYNEIFNGIFGSGVILHTNRFTTGSATQSFDILSNAISGFDAQGIAIFSEQTSSIQATIRDNSMFVINQAGVFVQVQESSHADLIVQGNTVFNSAVGVEIDPQGNGTLQARIEGNTLFRLRGCGFLALPIDSGSGAYDIRSNIFYENNLLSMNSGSAVTMISNNLSNVCLRMLNNLSTMEHTTPDYFLQNNGGGVFNVEPLVGNTGVVSQTGTTAVPAGFCSP